MALTLGETPTRTSISCFSGMLSPAVSIHKPPARRHVQFAGTEQRHLKRHGAAIVTAGEVS
jgi:hypothetical protein